MSQPLRIVQLAARIASHTAKIGRYLVENGMPYPSFDEDGPTHIQYSPEMEASRLSVIEDTQELNDLLQGPKELVVNHQHNRLLYLGFISHFQIATHVPVHSDISYAQLAEITGVNEAEVHRILRFAMANRIFVESAPGYVAHTAASRLLAEQQPLRDWAGANVEELWPAAMKGFSLAHGTDKPFDLELAKHPERARRFGGAMSFFTTSDGYSMHHLTDNYQWASAGTVVDVGGSHGEAAFAIASKFPNVRCLVQDLNKTIESCQEQPGINVTFMTHDFFEDQPVAADVYLLRRILHNWPDKYCLRILKSLVPALKPGSRVLVMEIAMPPKGTVPNSIEKKLCGMDLTMLEIGNARERSLEEWADLFARADSRLRYNGANRPDGSELTLIEATWQP